MTVKEKGTVSGNTNMIPFTKRLLIPSQMNKKAVFKGVAHVVYVLKGKFKYYYN